jgi:hypothetical protein
VDLPLYGRVLWRFKLIVGVGVFAAIALAVLAYARVSFQGGRPSLTPRQAQVWRADALLLVTQRGFPWGSSEQRYIPGNPANGLPPVPVGDMSRLSSVAMVYSQLADSDEVKADARPKPVPPDEKIATSPYAPASAPPGTVLPMVALSADAATEARAAALVNARVDAFTQLIRAKQEAAGTPERDRILIETLERGRPKAATLIAGRKKTLPLVVFMAVMIVTVGLSFMLENLRPRVRPVELDEAATPLGAPRRTA